MRSLRIPALRAAQALSIAACLTAVHACSPADGTTHAGNGGRGGAGSVANAGNGSIGGFTPLGGNTGTGNELNFGGDFGNSGGNGFGADGGGCSSEVHQGERLPLDIYFLVDTSGSMDGKVQGGTKWTVVSQALTGFLNDPANADIATGIGYFPQVDPNAPPTCTADADCVSQSGKDYGPCVQGIIIPFLNICVGCYCTQADGCSVEGYSKPSVPLALPPNHGPVVSDIGAHRPGGGTPTRPALDGAMKIASDWAKQNPGRTTIIVLATDGDPTGCNPNSVQDVANIAAAGLKGPPSIKTFVIGVGNSLTSLNSIAQAGGTDHAFVLDTGGDVAKQFSDALAQIRGAAVPCDFKVPAGPKVDPTKVNVTMNAPGKPEATIPRTTSGSNSDCGTDSGWYYDDPANPTLIKLCDATCGELAHGGTVAVGLGCKTIVKPPR